MSKIIQQDATLYSFLLRANCSTCFGLCFHPSSGARVNCNHSIWHWSNCMLPSAVMEESELASQDPWT